MEEMLRMFRELAKEGRQDRRSERAGVFILTLAVIPLLVLYAAGIWQLVQWVVL